MRVALQACCFHSPSNSTGKQHELMPVMYRLPQQFYFLVHNPSQFTPRARLIFLSRDKNQSFAKRLAIPI